MSYVEDHTMVAWYGVNIPTDTTIYPGLSFVRLRSKSEPFYFAICSGIQDHMCACETKGESYYPGSNLLDI